MQTSGFVVILICVLLAASVSRHIKNTPFTLPIIYVTMGLLISPLVLNLVDIDPKGLGLHIIAELTLVIVLANDASRINIRQFMRDHSLPQRLLIFGLPLTILLGAIISFLLFPEISIWEAIILAIVLTPTDASLGQSVVTNQKIPVRIRQALNIESGLNDGIALPLLLLAIALEIESEVSLGPGQFVAGVLQQMLIGGLCGFVLGFLGWLFIRWGRESQWMSANFQKISAFTLTLLAFGASGLLGGNGYISAFIFGLTFGNTFGRIESETLIDFSEIQVELLMLVTFVLFGAVMVIPALEQWNIKIITFAVLSLTVMRMLPVWISMIGAKVRPVTTLFMGWFGPRGIASILYAFTVLEAENVAGEKLIYNAVMVTILFSVFAHGLTAAPLSNRYGSRMSDIDKIESAAEEHKEVSEMPLQAGMG